MQQLLYRSQAAPDLAAGEVFRIIEGSARDNPMRDLTGFLIFAQDRFIQFLEGPGESIDLLLRELECDPRHHSIETIYRASATGRLFPAWRMQRVDFALGRIAEMLAQLRANGIPGQVVEGIRNSLEPRRAAA